MLIDQKKYQIVICDGDERFIESFLDDDMDVVVKQTVQYVMKKLEDMLVFYILLINGKKPTKLIGIYLKVNTISIWKFSVK